MDQTYIRDVANHVGEEVTIKGWLYNIRSSGKLMFPQLRDGSGIIQAVVS
ncbi:MAG TPA: OB-fold nucleic acid binding domain-containing protein, partial [Blastocatellia bacterium]|nr:OB-fold nucleic acid binding domain-containing protein [Blastocatellia bacterium]